MSKKKQSSNDHEGSTSSENKSKKKAKKKTVKKKTAKTVKRKTIVKKNNNAKILSAILILIVIALGVYYILSLNTDAKGGDDNNQNNQDETQTGDVAVYVNGKPISMEEVDSQYDQLPPEIKTFTTKEDFIDQLVDQELLYQKAQEDGIEITQEEEDTALDTLLQRNGLNKEILSQTLQDQGSSIEEFMTAFRKRLVITKLFNESVVSNIKINEDESRSYYEENIQAFSLPDQVRASHILVETEDEANAIKERIDAGEDFNDLAVELSIDPSAQTNRGDLGYFSREQMVAPFSEAAFALEVDEVSSPTQTSFGWHIIKLHDRQDASTSTFEEVEPQIIEVLRLEKSREFLDVFIVQLREGAEITYPDGSNEKDSQDQMEDNMMDDKGAMDDEDNMADDKMDEDTMKDDMDDSMDHGNMDDGMMDDKDAVDDKDNMADDSMDKDNMQDDSMNDDKMMDDKESMDSNDQMDDSMQEESLESCLSKNGAILYGSPSSSATLKQLDMFENPDEINYMDCSPGPDEEIQKQACKDDGIIGYPTWIVNGEQLQGVQDLDTLKAEANC